jgi:hypothetical protein
MATIFSTNGSQLVANFYLNGSGNVFTDLVVTGNANIGNLNVSGQSNLGPVGNVHITGGSNGQVLITDGAGNLSWSTVSGTGTVTSVGTTQVDPSTLGFTLTGGTITGAGVVTLNVPTAAALSAAMGVPGGYPALDGNSGNVLYGNGVWAPAGGGGGTGTVTSVATSGSGLGFTLSGGPITTTGTVTLATPTAAALRTTLNIGNVANANFNGNGAQVLAGNGAWVTNDTAPAGTTGQMQFNNGGVFGGSTVVYDSVSGNVSMSAKNIVDLADPIAAQDAATKAYVDLYAQGISTVIDPVQAVSDTNLAGTYNNGSAGVGSTLVLNTPITTIDGVPLVAGTTRILVHNQTSPLENGIYVYTNSTTLTRSTDADAPVELDAGSFVFCESGTQFNKSGWILTTQVTTVGVDPVIFTQFSGAGSYTAGTGLDLNGSEFRLANTTVTAAQYGNSTTVPQITVDAQGRLTSASNVAIAFPTYGNVAPLNLDGNVSNVLAGDGSWVQNATLPAGNIREIQWNSGSDTFAASNRLYISGSTGSLVLSNDSGTALNAVRYSNTADIAATGYSRARGTKAAITPVQVGDAIGQIFYTYTGNGTVTVDGTSGWAQTAYTRANIEALPSVSGAMPVSSYQILVGNGTISTSLEVARFSGNGAVELGLYSIAVANSVAIGINANAAGANSYAIGTNANASGADSFAIGSNTVANVARAIAIGSNAAAIGVSGVALGFNANAARSTSYAIGAGSIANGLGSYSIGGSANTTNTYAYAIGVSAVASGDRGYAIGAASNSGADSSYALGQTANASGANSYAIGRQANASAENSIAIGHQANATIANTIVLGTSSYNVIVPNTLTATGLLGINYATEDIAINAAAPAASTNFDLLTNSIQYSTVNATANVTLNVRGGATTTLNSVLGVGQSTVVTQMVTTGTTAFGVTALQVDSVAQTIRWAGGTAPTQSTNSTLAYTFNIIKTAATPTYVVLGGMTRFA